ncbi:hypothetical protein T4D_12788 [Trichinella pseudospiralis]|uniref:Uncharacterized protein n=1 Tax=Trichinella pseudospiralis TaxID=6337 RepID=A0A0V1FNH2_TRIPS|nr:hypothetical protein T4D_12788 [Trichinella pseudospiralis]
MKISTCSLATNSRITTAGRWVGHLPAGRLSPAVPEGNSSLCVVPSTKADGKNSLVASYIFCSVQPVNDLIITVI